RPPTFRLFPSTTLFRSLFASPTRSYGFLVNVGSSRICVPVTRLETSALCVLTCTPSLATTLTVPAATSVSESWVSTDTFEPTVRSEEHTSELQSRFDLV